MKINKLVYKLIYWAVNKLTSKQAVESLNNSLQEELPTQKLVTGRYMLETNNATYNSIHNSICTDITKCFQRVAQRKNYVIFTDNSKDYNLNLWFVRSNRRISNSFDDFSIVFWKTPENVWKIKVFRVTTDPGKESLINPMNKAGTAIIVPGQYRGTHKIDIHRRGTSSAHEALCQRLGSIKVYRDNNKDDILDIDPNTISEGHGINIHRPTNKSERTEQVGLSSAGCIVFAKRLDFDNFSNNDESEDTFMGLCRLAAKNWGNKFSITVLEINDILFENSSIAFWKYLNKTTIETNEK